MALTQLGNVREAIRRFNTNQSSYTDEEQRNLLRLALHYGTAYEPEAKPISKGLYNFANIASFGLMPESWRPHSIGQDYYGERGIDKFASGVGAVGGLAAAPLTLGFGLRAGMAGLGAAGRGARYAGGRLASRFPRAAGAAERGVGRARAGSERIQNIAREARDTGVLAKDYIVTSSPVQAIRTRLSESRLNNIATKLKNTGIAGEEGVIMGTARQAARGLEGMAAAGGRGYEAVAPVVGRGMQSIGRGIGRAASSIPIPPYPRNWNIGGGFSGYNIPY